MADKFNRTDFFQLQTESFPRSYDMLTNSINEFKFNRPMTKYQILESDLARPDLIAIKAYGSVDAMNQWWIIMHINSIADPFNDLYAGQILKIPAAADINDFLIFNQNR